MSTLLDNSIDYNTNVTDPPPVLPPPMYLPPEDPTQLPTPDNSLPPTRSGRIKNKPYFLNESFHYDSQHQDDCIIQDQMLDITSFSSISGKDIIYYHEENRQPDCKKIVQAMVKELNEHIIKGHFSLIIISKVPANTKILDSV